MIGANFMCLKSRAVTNHQKYIAICGKHNMPKHIVICGKHFAIMPLYIVPTYQDIFWSKMKRKLMLDLIFKPLK